MPSRIETLTKLLSAGQDNALLRYSLANEYLKETQYADAILHIEEAIKFNKDYSAAWKLFGKILYAAGKIEDAAATYQQGINIAKKNGDKQAEKEMQVFLKRTEKEKQ